MSEENKEPTKEQLFLDAYHALVKKHGYTFLLEPKWVKQENGGYVLIMETRVAPNKESTPVTEIAPK